MTEGKHLNDVFYIDHITFNIEWVKKKKTGPFSEKEEKKKIFNF